LCACGACGARAPETARGGGGAGPAPLPDARELSFEPPDAGPADPCGGYGVAVAPALGRIATAADQYMDALAAGTAGAGETFAVAIEKEIRYLSTIQSGVGEIDGAHARLLAGLGEMAAAARVGDQAAFKAGLEKWVGALADLEAFCPGAF
jgi:hypothetical protein